MSKPDQYRGPAWGGLIPLPRVYEPVPADLARHVEEAICRKGAIWRLQNAGGTSSIFLKMDADDGCTLFIKVLSAERSPELLSAEALAQWLRNEGVRVIVAETIAQLSDGRHLWSYPYHCGRPPKACAEDMAAIGVELGRLHMALRRHPLLAEWRKITAARLARLTAVRAALAGGKLRAGPEPALLQRVACDRSIDFLPDRYESMSCALALHGDLNRFNMLIDGRGCTFLDFEDVPHSVLPAIFDLATVTERVVMVDRVPMATIPLITALFDAYASITGHRPLPVQLPHVLRGLAMRALCSLAEIDPAGNDEQEWRKFFRLLSAAEQQSEIFLAAGDGK